MHYKAWTHVFLPIDMILIKWHQSELLSKYNVILSIQRNPKWKHADLPTNNFIICGQGKLISKY